MADEKTGEKTTVVPPYVLALVVCDAAHRDGATGKYTLLGTFSTINARQFPAIHKNLTLYFALTDGHGQIPIRFRLADANDKRGVVYEQTMTISFPNPRDIVEGHIDIGSLEFPEAGEYRLQLLVGQAPLMERRILLLQLQRPDQEAKK